jgi:hypothetical protein
MAPHRAGGGCVTLQGYRALNAGTERQLRMGHHCHQPEGLASRGVRGIHQADQLDYRELGKFTAGFRVHQRDHRLQCAGDESLLRGRQFLQWRRTEILARLPGREDISRQTKSLERRAAQLTLCATCQRSSARQAAPPRYRLRVPQTGRNQAACQTAADLRRRGRYGGDLERVSEQAKAAGHAGRTRMGRYGDPHDLVWYCEERTHKARRLGVHVVCGPAKAGGRIIHHLFYGTPNRKVFDFISTDVAWQLLTYKVNIKVVVKPDSVWGAKNAAIIQEQCTLWLAS